MRSSHFIFFRVFGVPFLRRLLPSFGFLLALVYLSDAVVDWTELRERLQTDEPIIVSLSLTAVILAWGLIVGRALRPAWQQPTYRFLSRQPLPLWRWAVSFLPFLSIGLIPVVGLWWLAPHYLKAPFHYLAFIGLFWPIMLGTSFRGAIGLVQTVAATTLFAVLVIAYTRQPVAVAAIATLISLLLFPLSLYGLRVQPAVSNSLASRSLTANSRIVAIVRRDLLCLWRTNRRSVLYSLVPATLAVLFMVAARVNGDSHGRDAFVIASILFAISVLPVYHLLSEVRTQLGANFARGSWPIGHSERAVALILLTTTLIAPPATAIAVAGSSMGVWWAVVFIAFSTTVVSALTALFASNLNEGADRYGVSLWVILLNTVIVLVAPAGLYIPLVAVAVALSLRYIIGQLDRFAIRHTKVR